MSPVACIPLSKDEARIEALIDRNDFDGFMDLYHLSKISRVSALAHHLASLLPVEGVPFPASIAIVRGIIVANSRMDWHESANSFARSLRFGVHAHHMCGVREVTYSEMQKAFAGIRFRRDVSCTELHLEDKLQLLEWREFEFRSIPSPTSDALWDLFEMDQSPLARANRGQVFPVPQADGRSSLRRQSILVAATRNRANLITPEGAVVPAYGMGHNGAGVVISLVVEPRFEPDLLPKLLQEGYPSLLTREPLRPIVPGESWLIASYEPPPLFDGKGLGLMYGHGDEDEWVGGPDIYGDES